MSAISPNNNLSPLAFYPSREAREQWWGYGKTPNICVPKNFLPSLQIRRPHNTTRYINIYERASSVDTGHYIDESGNIIALEEEYQYLASKVINITGSALTDIFSAPVTFVVNEDKFTYFESEFTATKFAVAYGGEGNEEILQIWSHAESVTISSLPSGTTLLSIMGVIQSNTIEQTTSQVSVAPITGCEIRNAITNAHESSWIPTAFKIVNHGNYDYIFLTASKQYNTLPEGAHYLEITDGTNTWFSDNFTTKDADYLKIEWWDESNLDLADGTKLVFLMPNQSWFNWKPSFYIPTDIGMPDYEFEEEVEERGGYQFPLQQISYKKYKFNFLAPEVVCDAMRLIRLSDHIEITKGSAKYVANTFLMTPSWQDQGYLARVDCEFTTDTIVKKNGKSI